VKKHLKANGGFEEGPGLHFAASFTSGIVAQTVTMPADTLKVRFTRTVYKRFSPTAQFQNLIATTFN